MRESTDFIRTIINEDLRTNKHGGKVITRFPPEPNGYLHIGHAKSICLNFGLALEYKGTCHLRFDDTDPVKEDTEFENAIADNVRWLGFDWGGHLYHASDYFGQLYDLAVKLIKMKKAYVCSQTLEEMRQTRGTVTEAGSNSPYRERSVEENLDLFARMKAGEFPDGAHTLRAKIDMASPNMKMRDPALYRIRHATHHRTGDDWCLYPLYDYTHCLSDSFEGITHSICTLEFENNRELYDWIINTLDMPHKPHQYEFARLNINYTVMSKRKILELVTGGYVDGWDDPRLLTLAGLRRRGYTPEAIRKFCASVGIAKANSIVDMAQLEHAIRDDLNTRAPRVLAVLDPLKVVITNYPQGHEETLDAPYWPEDIGTAGSRPLPFSREIYIERTDFTEQPPKGYYRLSPGAEVRLRHAYIIRCDKVIKNADGSVQELHCSYDQNTPLGQNPADGRRIKGTIHWLSIAHALPATVRAYDRLFTVEHPDDAFLDQLNPHSREDYPHAVVEPSLAKAAPESHWQFERHGYFVTDLKESRPGAPVFNRTVTLKDSWTKQEKAAPVEVAKPKAEPAAQMHSKHKEEVVLTPADQARVDRFVGEYALSREYAVLLAQDEALAHFLVAAVKQHNNPVSIANWLINEVLRVRKEQQDGKLPITPDQLGELVQCIDSGAISSKIAKEIFVEMLTSGQMPKAIIKAKGMEQISNVDELVPIVDRILAAHPDVIEQIKAGRDKRLGFLVGLVMKETGGKASPQQVNALLTARLQ